MTMERVFIGGSRAIRKLNQEVKLRLDKIMEKGFPILIGDASGADKAVQDYLWSRNYDQVVVFCMDGGCRNNIGGWKSRCVVSSNGARGRDYYSTKDVEMTNESTIGFMLWDGDSRGTLANIMRLVGQNKKVVVFVAPINEFRTIRSQRDASKLVTTDNGVFKRRRAGGKKKSAQASKGVSASLSF